MRSRHLAAVLAVLTLTTSCTPGAPQPEPPPPPTPVTGETIVRFTASGTEPDKARMSEALRLLTLRAQALQLGEPQVRPADARSIQLRLPGQHGAMSFLDLVSPSRLSIRRIVSRTFQEYPGVDPTEGQATTFAAVQAKIGPEPYAAAEAIPLNEASFGFKGMDAFHDLTVAEIAVLPPRMQFVVYEITCEQLATLPPPIAAQSATACGRDSRSKYLMAETIATSGDIASAAAEHSADGWGLRLTFTAAATPRWAAATRDAAANTATPACEPEVTDDGHCRLAILLDNVVVADPTIRARNAGSPLIPLVSEDQAHLYAARMSTPPLPIAFTIGDIAVK